MSSPSSSNTKKGTVPCKDCEKRFPSSELEHKFSESDKKCELRCKECAGVGSQIRFLQPKGKAEQISRLQTLLMKLEQLEKPHVMFSRRHIRSALKAYSAVFGTMSDSQFDKAMRDGTAFKRTKDKIGSDYFSGRSADVDGIKKPYKIFNIERENDKFWIYFDYEDGFDVKLDVTQDFLEYCGHKDDVEAVLKGTFEKRERTYGKSTSTNSKKRQPPESPELPNKRQKELQESESVLESQAELESGSESESEREGGEAPKREPLALAYPEAQETNVPATQITAQPEATESRAPAASAANVEPQQFSAPPANFRPQSPQYHVSYDVVVNAITTVSEKNMASFMAMQKDTIQILATANMTSSFSFGQKMAESQRRQDEDSQKIAELERQLALVIKQRDQKEDENIELRNQLNYESGPNSGEAKRRKQGEIIMPAESAGSTAL